MSKINSCTVNHELNQHEHSGSVKSYIVGFILSILLTVIPFYLVAQHVIATNKIIGTIVITAILQLLIQLIFFLHINDEKTKPRWNLIALIFAGFVVFVLVGGSMWIMWNLNYNMMRDI